MFVVWGIVFESHCYYFHFHQFTQHINQQFFFFFSHLSSPLAQLPLTPTSFLLLFFFFNTSLHNILINLRPCFVPFFHLSSSNTLLFSPLRPSVTFPTCLVELPYPWLNFPLPPPQQPFRTSRLIAPYPHKTQVSSPYPLFSLFLRLSHSFAFPIFLSFLSFFHKAPSSLCFTSHIFLFLSPFLLLSLFQPCFFSSFY